MIIIITTNKLVWNETFPILENEMWLFSPVSFSLFIHIAIRLCVKCWWVLWCVIDQMRALSKCILCSGSNNSRVNRMCIWLSTSMFSFFSCALLQYNETILYGGRQSNEKHHFFYSANVSFVVRLIVEWQRWTLKKDFFRLWNRTFG